MVKRKKKLKMSSVLLASSLILIIIFISITVVFQKFLTESVQESENQYTEYQNHFVFIADDMQYSSWEDIYEGARVKGEELGIYVERMGSGQASSYKKEQLIEIAVASKVDGIIVQGDESKKTKEMIDLAVDSDIPVVTFLVDSNGSGRQSFIGIGSYNLGREYGREMIRIATKETKKAVILMDSSSVGNEQSIIYTGILETLANEGNHLDIELETKTIDNQSMFSAEEAIRDLFLKEKELPDFMVCLNEVNTASAYQAVVDYNKVGQVNIIGYNRSETIVKAIDKEIISAAISMDDAVMGSQCTETLDSFLKTGHVSDYVAMDAISITKNNIGEYIEDGE